MNISHTDTVARFITAREISDRYEDAKRKFYAFRNLYRICRSHAIMGGAWPTLTRNNRIKMERAAKSCRNWQKMKNNLERMRAQVSFELD